MTTLPHWLLKRTPKHHFQKQIRALLQDDALHSVCESAACPNRGECFQKKVMTFMILGDTCTRSCRFCAVGKGACTGPDRTEPQRIAEAAKKLGLLHVVITSVTRDDLPDGGARHFVDTVGAVHALVPGASLEVLTPDFLGREELWEELLASPLTVFNHNIETVPRLYGHIRPQAEYRRSLRMLRFFTDRSSFAVKSGIMVGLGETQDEVRQVLRDLKDNGCSIVTIGQYLRPSARQVEVVEYVDPQVFEEYQRYGADLGLTVFAGPWVRSSYCAQEVLQKLNRSRPEMRSGCSN